MQRTVVLYHDSCTWEIDYVFRELLRDEMKHARVFFLTSAQLRHYKETPKDNVIIVFSSNDMSAADILAVVKRVKPKIVMHMSDEYGTRPEYCELADHVPVVFHQHTFAAYPRKANMVQLPLGFKTGFRVAKELPPATKRNLQWAFIGTIKQGSLRAEMIETFKKRFPLHDAQIHGGVSTLDMAQIYADAVFVPNDRGNVRLDCFRLYEAMLAGCIPVVVGSQKECKETFYFDNDFPPFVLAKTWDAAADKCATLLENTDKLLICQNLCLEWMQRNLQKVRDRVHKELSV